MTANDDIRIADLVRTVKLHLRFVLGITTIVFLILLTIIVTDKPMYRAYVTLALSPPLIDPGSIVSPGGIMGLGDSFSLGAMKPRTSADHAFALLRSREISRRLIQSENLMPVLFADHWDADRQAWANSDPDRQPTMGDAVELLDSEIRFVSKSASTGFIRVNIELSDPKLAAHWANRIVEITDNMIRERDIEEAKRNIRFLEEQAASSSLQSVKQLIYELIESHTKTTMVATVEENYAFTIIDPAVAPQIDESINMPVSFKLSLALFFAIGCGVLWVIVSTQLRSDGSWRRPLKSA